MSWSCREIENHVGPEVYQTAKTWTGQDCDWWTPEVKEKLMHDQNHQSVLKKLALKWVDYVKDRKPFLAPGSLQSTKNLKKWIEQAPTFQIKEMMDLSSRLGPLSAIGYDHVALERETSKHAHGPHYKFRNEWWTFHGTCEDLNHQRGFLFLQIHRHTLVPPSLWTSREAGSDYSVLCISLRFLEPGGKEWQNGENALVRQSQGLSDLNVDSDHFFQVKQGRWFLQSVYQDTLFPLDIYWGIGTVPLQVRLDNTKPMLMVHSNGCLQCSDGIGLKMYTYPELQGNGKYGSKLMKWNGYWDHTWESSMFPKGLSNSLFMRALINLETSVHSLPANHTWTILRLNKVDTQEEWFFAVLGWSQYNQVQYAIKVEPDGVTRKISENKVWIEAHQFSSDPGHFPFSLQVHRDQDSDFVLTLIDKEPVQTAYLVSGTFWNEEQRMFGSLQIPEHTEDRVFRYEVENNDMIYSWLIWLLPLLVIVLLMSFSVFLVIKRVQGNRHPWTTSQRHTSFFKF